MSTSDKLIDHLQMPKSAVEAMAKAVPTDVVKAIVGDHYGRWAPTPPKSEPSESKPTESPSALQRDLVRVLTGEALDRWVAARERPNPEVDYNPFSREWMRR